MACVVEGTVAKRRDLNRELHPQKTFPWLVDALVLESSTTLVLTKKDQLLVQEVDGAALSSKGREIENLLVAPLVVTENLNLSGGGHDQSYCRGTDEGVGGLGQASTRGTKFETESETLTCRLNHIDKVRDAPLYQCCSFF